MVKIYHGSTALFDKPDFNRIKNTVTFGVNEYGFGFYGSTYSGDAQGILGGRNTAQAFIYEMEVPDEDFRNKWLSSDEPIGEQKFAVLKDMADKKGYGALQAVLKKKGCGRPWRRYHGAIAERQSETIFFRSR